MKKNIKIVREKITITPELTQYYLNRNFHNRSLNEEKAEIDEEFKESFDKITLLGEKFSDDSYIEGESDGKEMHYYFPLLNIVNMREDRTEG